MDTKVMIKGGLVFVEGKESIDQATSSIKQRYHSERSHLGVTSQLHLNTAFRTRDYNSMIAMVTKGV